MGRLLFFAAVAILCYLCFNFLFKAIRKANWTRFGGGFHPDGRGKQFLDVVPLVDEMGNPNTNLWILEVGRSGYPCIPQWKLSKLREDEQLMLVLEADQSISIRNSLNEKLGEYPPEEMHYRELQTRLRKKQLVLACVRNWGLESSNSYGCGIAVYVYGDA